MNIKRWFKKKPNPLNDANLPASTIPYYPIYASTYKIGWMIYTKDGTNPTRFWENVSHNQRIDITSIAEHEVKQMHVALELAATEKKEFVNLSSNLLRLSDVSKIIVTNTVEK
jgi:hypothetical protein